MPPLKSLLELATMACIKNFKLFESVGDLPFELVKHILMKVDNAHQLRQIELNSPQIQGETGEIWLKLIDRDFPMEYKASPTRPKNPAEWHLVWEKYKMKHLNALKESEKQLRAGFANLKKDKEKNTSKIVGGKQVPGSLRVGAPKRPWGPVRDTLASSGMSASKQNSGSNVMRKVRRETKELAAIHGHLSKPTKPPAQLSGLKKAPVSMIDEHKRASQPAYRPFPKEIPKETPKVSAVEGHQQHATCPSGSLGQGDANEALPTARSKVNLIKPSMQRSKSAVTFPGKSNLSPFQKKFGQSKSLKVLGATAAFTPVVKKVPVAPTNDRRTSKDKAKDIGIATSPASTQNAAFKPLPIIRSVSPEAHPSNFPEDLVEQLNQTADDENAKQLEVAKQQQARKRKAVDIFMRPKRRFN